MKVRNTSILDGFIMWLWQNSNEDHRAEFTIARVAKDLEISTMSVCRSIREGLDTQKLYDYVSASNSHTGSICVCEQAFLDIKGTLLPELQLKFTHKGRYWDINKRNREILPEQTKIVRDNYKEKVRRWATNVLRLHGKEFTRSAAIIWHVITDPDNMRGDLRTRDLTLQSVAAKSGFSQRTVGHAFALFERLGLMASVQQGRGRAAVRFLAYHSMKQAMQLCRQYVAERLKAVRCHLRSVGFRKPYKRGFLLTEASILRCKDGVFKDAQGGDLPPVWDDPATGAAY
jgi:hypothetical protein